VAYRFLGPASPWGWVIGAAINAVIILCFAEVGSRFSDAGGGYLYARRALPRLPAILVGWLTYLTRLSAVAAAVNLFTVNLGEFFPWVERDVIRISVLTAMLLGLAAVNYRGARDGARLSSFFTVAKLIPLAVFVIAGSVFLIGRAHVARAPSAPVPVSTWLQALILIGFAYGGFDGAVLAMGEAKNPRRDLPFALVVAMISLAFLYTSIQVIVNAALPNPSSTERPLVEAARVFLGSPGARFIAAGALISQFGFLSANFLNGPRLTFALSEHADAPAVFGRVHARFRTPYISILTFTFFVWVLAVWGNFQWNATLSGVARLFVYGSTCLSLIVLRRKEPGGAAVPIPGGMVLGGIGIALCTLLAARMGKPELIVIAGVTVLGSIHWLLVRGRMNTEHSG